MNNYLKIFILTTLVMIITCNAFSQNDTIVIFLKNGIQENLAIKDVEKINMNEIQTGKINIPLRQGWNMISSFISPELPDSMENVCNDILSNLIIAKNNDGEVFIPQYEINDIGNWNITQCYQFYMNQDTTLSINGEIVNPIETPITLRQGWNMISYIRNSELDCETAFASLTESENLIIVKDNYGNVYIPEYGINSIVNLIPGQGYQIFVLNADVLVYSGN